MTTLETLQARESALLCRTYGRYPLSVVRGKGSRLWDADGREYIDLLGGIAVTALGHCHEELAEVMAAQSRKLVHVSNLFYQEEQLRLAERLLGTGHHEKAFFCNSGAEANEAAIKLARRYQQRVRQREAWEVITLSSAFHGRTLATVAATGQAKFQDGFMPIPEGFIQVPWGDLAALEAAMGPHTAAVLVEIVQGEGGIRPMPQAYAQGIEALCRKHDVLFMVDEVQSGMCRSGKFWAFQQVGLKPNVITTAKALANGLPMGAMLCTNEASQGFATGSHATTFGGGALVSAVADKVVEIMLRDHLADRAEKLGQAAVERFRALATRTSAIGDIRGMGLLIGVDLALPEDQCTAVWRELIEAGFVVNLTQKITLRLLPALNIDEADLVHFTETLEKVLKKY